jgi:membrane protease YdiL (CAAX protease family)
VNVEAAEAERDNPSRGSERRLPLRFTDLLLVALFGVIGVQVLGALAVAHGWVDLRQDSQSTPVIAGFVVLLTAQACGLLLVVYLVAVKWRKASWRDLGFRPSAKQWYGRAGLVVAIGLGLSAVNGLVLEALFEKVPENPQMQVIATDGFSWMGLIGMLLVAGVLVPVVEETAFRGLLYRWLRERIGFWPGLIISSLLFGVLHGILFLVPVLAILGALFAWLYERSGSIWPAIAAHGLFNGIMVVGVYVSLAVGYPAV